MKKSDLVKFIRENRFINHKKKYIEDTLDNAVHKDFDSNELKPD
jgi:hypothetical protein